MHDILDTEMFAERLIADRRIEPVRFFYEDMMAGDPSEILRAVHRLLFGTAAPDQAVRPSVIERIGTTLNEEFEEQFRDGRADFVRGLEQARPDNAACASGEGRLGARWRAWR